MNNVPEESPLKKRNRLLSQLLNMERRLRRISSLEEWRHFMLHAGRQAVSYRQAVLWLRQEKKGVHIAGHSDIHPVDTTVPYMREWQRICLELANNYHEASLVSLDHLAVAPAVDWQQAVGRYILWLPFVPQNGLVLGGICLTRDEPWNDFERFFYSLLVESGGQSFVLLTQTGGGPRSRWRGMFHVGRLTKNLLPLLLLLLAWVTPVQQSVVAPAEVVAIRPLVVAAPMDGVVAMFHVEHNARVKKGDLLFSLDDSALVHQQEVAQRAVAVAQAEWLKATQSAFADDRSKAEMAWLESEIQIKKAENDYVSSLLQQVQVKAEQDGIALFRDRNDWLGKPVQTGEKILFLADPEQVELKIDLPVAEAMALSEGAKVRFFANTDPLHPLAATVRTAAYEAEVTAEQVLAYRLLASLATEQTKPRLGSKGTARILGGEVSLLYYLFRRPLFMFRQWLGW